ncbi:zinc ribbon domain-containing protein [Nonomuraea sp. NPDC050691]|uniref:zinc ribbon domain-containing protein n=1 Tax=Nonomuraea sp. NPDC050691 TaxID=3155661 RepID=UPI0033E27FA9
MFPQVLTDKAESAGRELIAVDPRSTSRTCSRCGHCAKKTASPKPRSDARRAITGRTPTSTRP